MVNQGELQDADIDVLNGKLAEEVLELNKVNQQIQAEQERIKTLAKVKARNEHYKKNL